MPVHWSVVYICISLCNVMFLACVNITLLTLRKLSIGHENEIPIDPMKIIQSTTFIAASVCLIRKYKHNPKLQVTDLPLTRCTKHILLYSVLNHDKGYVSASNTLKRTCRWPRRQERVVYIGHFKRRNDRFI
jgi:hypothetical protein